MTGWGQSRPSVDELQHAAFLSHLINELRLSRPVLVSPSLAGSYAIPYLMDGVPSECEKRARGLISIASVAHDRYEWVQYSRCEVTRFCPSLFILPGQREECHKKNSDI